MSRTPAFDSELLALLDATHEVIIETTRANGRPRRTVIWVVADGADAYIRSVRGSHGRWFRDLVARPEAMLTVGAERVPVTVVPAVDEPSIELVSELFHAKYDRTAHASTVSMLQPATLETTLRVLPA